VADALQHRLHETTNAGVIIDYEDRTEIETTRTHTSVHPIHRIMDQFSALYEEVFVLARAAELELVAVRIRFDDAFASRDVDELARDVVRFDPIFGRQALARRLLAIQAVIE